MAHGVYSSYTITVYTILLTIIRGAFMSS